MHPLLSFISTTILVIYAWFRQSLTLYGILAAIITAAAHAVHPWDVFYGLLVVFFLSGTFVTKVIMSRTPSDSVFFCSGLIPSLLLFNACSSLQVKHTTKSTLTTSSTPSPSTSKKAPPRTATQVFANSLPASAFILLHAYHLNYRLQRAPGFILQGSTATCLPYPSPQTQSVSSPTKFGALLNILPYVIVAAYATAAADTFASELGILSRSRPVLLPSLLRGKVERVPPGTNGGITSAGVFASGAGALIIGVAAAWGLPLCDGSDDKLERKAAFVHIYSLDRIPKSSKQWELRSRAVFALVVMLTGVFGALVDSLLGAWCQASVVDSRSGKVVEADGGGKVIYQSKKGKLKETRKVLVGRDWLSNNGVNFVTGAVTCAFAMAGTVVWLGGLGRMTETARAAPF